MTGRPCTDEVRVKVPSSKQEISLKKIFGGSQILTINATKFAGLDEIPIYPFAYWNLKPAKLWSCFCLSFAWFCAHLTLFAERYASESFFLILSIHQQGFGNNV